MRTATIVSCLLGFSASAFAQHAGDVILTVDAGRIVTNVGTTVDGFAPARVFASEMGEIAPGFTDEPGFDCDVGTFPFPSSIEFRIRGPLLRWENNIGDGRDPETLHIAFGPLGPVDSPACNTTVQGFALSVGSNGTWHRHLEFTLDDTAPPGVYILGLDLHSSSAEIDPSEPFWIVFNHESDEASHDAAIAWALENLAARPCAADFDGSGEVSVPDIFAFLSAWFAGPDGPQAWRADFDGSCMLGVPDIFAFLSAWFAGCP